jgi:hypothetical protein
MFTPMPMQQTDDKDDDGDTTTNTTPSKAATATATTYMNDCMNAIQTIIRNKIRTVTVYKAGKRDAVGIVLYNTKYRTPIQDVAAGMNLVKTTRKNKLDTSMNEDNDEDDDGEDEDDEDEDDMLYGQQPHPHAATTNVHEFVPFEPPGVGTIERMKSILVPTSTTIATTTALTANKLDLQKEYCSSHIDSINVDNNVDDNLPLLSSSSLSSPSIFVPPPLLLALRKAMNIYTNSTYVKKTRNTSAGKWEVPDMKHIWIITPNDDPCLTNNNTNTNTITGTGSDKSKERDEMIRILRECVQDIQENDIQIHLWPITITGSHQYHTNQKSFDQSKFYNIINIHKNIDSYNTITSSNDFIQHLDAVYKKTRPAYRVPFLLPNWQQHQEQYTNKNHLLFLDFYNVHQIQKEPSVLPIHQSTGKVLGKVRQLVTLDDGGGHVITEKRSFDTKQQQQGSFNTQRQRQLRTYFEFGNEYVPFSLRDKVVLKKLCNINPNFASLVLLGFKPSSSIPFYHTIEKSYFAYPSESSSTASQSNQSNNKYSNSIDAIAHLHASMIRHNVVGIGELLTRVTATSRLVAIRPLPEVLRQVTVPDSDTDTDNDVFMLVRPPGLLITTLPFEDEMRVASSSSTQTNTNSVSEEMIQATMNLIEQQTFPNDVEIGVDFANAAMCRFWNYIEHIAYNEDIIEDHVQYDTEINEEHILQHSGKQIEALQALLPESTIPEKVPSIGQKRKVASKQSKSLPENDSQIDWFTIVQEGTLSKCTVPELKAKLRSIGEPVNGNKPVVRIFWFSLI